jgi:predicted nucleotidyltransferase
MITYKLSFEQIRQNARLGDMLAALERGFAKFDIDFYLVGAVSRDVWLTGINNITPRRSTGDIDFAVYINDKGVYEALKEYLLTEEGFQPYRQNAFVLIYKDGTEVDLLPFGAVEDEDRRVTVQGTGVTSVHVDGFHEVYEDPLPQVEMGEHTFKFCSLPGIVLLKMIAWEDRPDSRTSDIIDICDVLAHYFDMHSEEIYERHNDIFTEEGLEDASLTDLGARVLGREIRTIAQRDDKLLKRVMGLLEINAADAATSHMATIMVQYFNNTIEENLHTLQQLKQGLEESSNEWPGKRNEGSV